MMLWYSEQESIHMAHVLRERIHRLGPLGIPSAAEMVRGEVIVEELLVRHANR